MYLKNVSGVVTEMSEQISVKEGDANQEQGQSLYQLAHDLTAEAKETGRYYEPDMMTVVGSKAG